MDNASLPDGLGKSAALLASLDPGIAEQIIARLPEKTRRLICREIGNDRRVHASPSPAVRGALDNYRPAQIVEVLADEHPQFIAVVISTLAADKAVDCLHAFGPATQMDLVRRLAALGPIEN